MSIENWANDVRIGSNCSWSAEEDAMLRTVGVDRNETVLRTVGVDETVEVRSRHPQVQKETERYWKQAYENGELERPTLRIFNPGQGTTATRFVHKMMSKLGGPGCHFLGPCGNLTRNGSTFDWASEATGWWRSLERCAVKGFKMKGCDTARLLEKTREILKALLQSNIAFISDDPYSLLTVEIVEAMKPSGLMPYFFWTSRDPVVWALKRVAEHGRNFMCRPEVVKAHNLSNAFDLIECLTVANSTPENPVYFSQVMVPLVEVPTVQLAGAFALHSDFLHMYLPKDRIRHYCAWDDDDHDPLQHLILSVLHGLDSDFIIN